MKDLNIALPLFLDLLKKSVSGSQIKFSLDYAKNEINIHSSCSGFLKELYLNDKVCAHLRNGYISLQYFK